jgi:lipopolysaccharide biosynthesis protein
MMRCPRRATRGRPRVVEVSRTAVTVEGGDEPLATQPADRVAFIAHWAAVGRLSRSVVALVTTLTDAGYAVVLVSACEVSEALEWPAGRPRGVTVLRRPNLGYDFGSWATAIDRYPRALEADRVLLLNDSMLGPFGPIDHLLELFHASAADVWGITDTTQFGHHLQSYCLGFRGRSLAERPLRRFWNDIRAEPTKTDVIWRNEIGLSSLLRRERFAWDVAVPYQRLVREGENPTIIGWRALLDRGVPFVKRQLVNQPEVAPDSDQVRPEVQRRFATDVDDWL